MRGLPFSQVQSASEKGSTLATSDWAEAFAAGVAALVAAMAVFAGAAAVAGAVGATGTVAFALLTAVSGCSCAFDFLSSASNSSMRFLIASSSFSIAGGIC